MKRSLLAFLIVGGCGNVPSPDVDGSPIDSSLHLDAAPPPCDLSAPWGTPVAVAGLEGYSGVWVSADEKTAIVGAPNPTTQDLFIATRGSTSGPFGPPVFIPASTADNDYQGTLSPDGFTLYWNAGGDVHDSVRGSLADAFVTSSTLAVAATPAASEGDPLVTASGLYFERDDNDGNGNRIWFAPREAGGFGAPVHLTELDGDGTTVEGAMTPRLSADELTIYLLSRRGGGAGARDIWMATRASLNDPFSTPTDVTEVDTSDDEWPGALSVDGCRLYISRATGSFVASKPPL